MVKEKLEAGGKVVSMLGDRHIATMHRNTCKDSASFMELPGQVEMFHKDNRRSHIKLTNLERERDTDNNGHVRNGERHGKTKHHQKAKLTVSNWTGTQSEKNTHRKPSIYHSNRENPDGNFFDGSERIANSSFSGGSEEDWVHPKNSVGCCACLRSASRRSSFVVHKTDRVALPANVHQTDPQEQKIMTLKEDHTMFLILATLLLIYMALGALVFQAFEEEYEMQARSNFLDKYTSARKTVNDSINSENVTFSTIDNLIFTWGNMSDEGYTPQNRRLWDYPGSFYFVYALVATIGKSPYSLFCFVAVIPLCGLQRVHYNLFNLCMSHIPVGIPSRLFNQQLRA
nr:uncharacterized protein LOC128699709 [Cherax quadricarinatus]